MERIRKLIQEIYLEVLIYQKWKGNIPNFKIIEREIKICQNILMLKNKKFKENIIEDKKKIIDPKDWEIK